METILSQFDADKYVDGVRKESFDEGFDKGSESRQSEIDSLSNEISNLKSEVEILKRQIEEYKNYV